MDKFLDNFNSELFALMLNQEKSNQIYKMCISLVNNMKKFSNYLINDENGLNPSQALDISSTFVSHKLTDFSTNYRRCKKNASSELYVPPQQLSLGVRWEFVKGRDGIMSVPALVSCKYQYVPITQTIVSLFLREDFREAYLNYNGANEKRVPGVYTDFCSGDVFRNNELFKAHPNSLQIEIATDDFEVCDPLGSKSTLHKICAVYFSIKNMPPEYRSKLNNISVVALCNSDDLKTKYTDFNDIWRVIVKDIAELEKGVYVGNGLKLRGTIINLSADNLGANLALGFVENFGSAHFYCRFCECDKNECKALTKEMP